MSGRIVRVDAHSRDRDVAISFSQRRIWLLAQLEGGNEAYNVPYSMHLRGLLNSAVLRRSLDAIFARHEVLRSVFVTVDGEPRVKLLPAKTSVPFTEIDLRGVPRAREHLPRILAQEAVTPFDLAEGPLIRAGLIHLSDQEHIFLLTQHHIVTDGWSMSILVRELSTLYGAYAEGHPDPLAPLTIQYPDYAAWQQQHITAQRLQTHIAYWRTALAGAPYILELPTDRPHPPAQSFDGDRITVNLGHHLTTSLKHLSLLNGTTLFMTLLAAWAVVLARLSGQDEVLVGIPTANRTHPDVDPLIGLFLNTLALRIDLSGNPSIADMLARVRRTVLGAQDHQELPFEQVVELLQPSRILGRTPLFQVMFSWQSIEEQKLELPHLHAEPTPDYFGRVKFDLELGLREVGGCVVGALAYSTTLFEAHTVERHVEYFCSALSAMANNSQMLVGHVPLLSPAERTLLLETWNHTEAPYPQGLCVHQLFEQQVERTPDAAAVIFRQHSLTYRELNLQANSLAHYLIAHGVRPDQPVALCLGRTPLLIIGLIAILKAGGAYVPLDPAYPSKRLIQILNDATPLVLLCDDEGRAALGDLPSPRLTVIDLQTSSPPWSQYPVNNQSLSEIGLNPDHLVYVIYTSGSTGIPKGIAMPHRAMVNLIQWNLTTFSISARSRTLQFSALGFDACFQEIFSTFALGDTLVLLEEWMRRDPRALASLLNDQGIARIFMPPLMLQSLAEHIEVSAQIPRSLKDVVVAGEQLRISSEIRSLFHHLPDCRLHNYYGPTETHVVTSFTMAAEPEEWGDLAPIGRPIANTRIYILDRIGGLAPRGTVGEIYIGGANVARGYLTRAELTAERFLRDPFCSNPRARMYRSGDLARYLPDGNIAFLGRTDRQVKIRGFRIEPMEIEGLITEHPAVHDAVVLAREDLPGEKRLVAYMTTEGEMSHSSFQELSVALRVHLAASLPEYMVPVAFVRLQTLPLNPSGKLNYDAFPSPEADAFSGTAYETPRGATEEALSELWEELLGVGGISRYHNFFEIGGHSLLAVRLLSRLPRTLGIELSLSALFSHPTIASLARAIDETLATAGPLDAQSIAPIRRRI